MDRTKFLTIIIVTLLLINIGMLAFLFISSKEKGRSEGPGPGRGPMEIVIEQLDFSPEQQDKFIELRNEHRSGMELKRDSIKRLHETLLDLLKSDTIDMAKADSLATVIAAKKKDLDLFTFEHFRKLRQLCDEKQKRRFDNLLGEMQRALMPSGAPPPPRH